METNHLKCTGPSPTLKSSYEQSPSHEWCYTLNTHHCIAKILRQESSENGKTQSHCTHILFDFCRSNNTMELADRAVGFLLSFISLSIFTYYTFWVIILPFVDSDHFVHKYFLPQEFAILIPVFAGVVLLCFLCMFIGYVMLKSKKKKKV
ncbi:unnamed protein product [Ilex paraguariensis]|uniref:Dolichol phosphate-mannose biosynthesis regulatory protein n=2 Tax=Ilex paraguariensis TaxID=185542 RepID=A0ABC8R5T2_9AQUA